MRWTVFLLLVTGCFCQGVEKPQEKEKSRPQPPYTFELKVGGHRVWVELATTPQARERGLMWRASLPPDCGMLFVYPEPAPRSFWMRNTKIPLSLAYIDQSGVIFQIERMRPFDETPVRSRKPAQFVLEMADGWFRQHGVGVGARVEGLEKALEIAGFAR